MCNFLCFRERHYRELNSVPTRAGVPLRPSFAFCFQIRGSQTRYYILHELHYIAVMQCTFCMCMLNGNAENVFANNVMFLVRFVCLFVCQQDCAKLPAQFS